MSRFCDCCGKPVHLHSDRSARYRCEHCQQVLCDLQVRVAPSDPGKYLHTEPFCIGLVEKT